MALFCEMPDSLAPMRRLARELPYYEDEADAEPRWSFGFMMLVACTTGGLLWLAVLLPLIWLMGGL